MNNPVNRIINRFGLLLIFCFLTGATSQLYAQKLTAEEVVQKHIQSIGSPNDIAAVKTRVIAGTALLTLKSPGSGQNSGLSLMFSEADKTAIAMNFGNPDYPHEKFGYDGKDVIISYIKPGIRSTLGDFIYQRSGIFKDGLLGGTLSSAWPLLNLDKQKVKLEYAGTKKIDGRQTHELKYYPRKGSDLKISMFFDAETFHHIRTEYEQVVTNQMGAAPDAPRTFERELRYQMIEEFSGFKKEDKVTLPHTYKIRLSLERRLGGNYIADWEINLSKFSFNQPLEVKWFDVNAT